MSRRPKTAIPIFLVALLLPIGTVAASWQPSIAPGARVDPRLFAVRPDRSGLVPAIVVFRTESGLTSRQALARLSSRIPAESLLVRRAFAHFPAASVRVSPRVLHELERDPTVRAVVRDGRVRAMLREGVALIRGDRAHALGFEGSGQVVAVIDTGIDYGHAELGGGGFPNSKVIGGHDFANDDGKPMDDQGHGTSVAGIIASSRGVAPKAKLVALKALDDQGEGNDSDSLAAIDWAIEKRSELGITLINMSLGGESHRARCDAARPDYAEAAAAAARVGIVILAASGNEAKDGEIAEPACISSIVSVGAVYDANLSSHEYCNQMDPLGVFCIDQLCDDSNPQADDITCYSNVSPDLDVLAPSHDCETTKLGGGWEDGFGGTSAATPYAAGVAALVFEAGGGRTADALRSTLRASGKMILDDRTALSFPRVDAEAAIRAVSASCTLPPAPAAPTVPTGTIPAGTSYTISWSSITDAILYEIEEYEGSLAGAPLTSRKTSITRATYNHGGGRTIYAYRVRASRTCGAGPWSETSSVTVESGGLPGTLPHTYVIAGAAHAEGVGTALWRTDLAIFNPGTTAVTAFVTFLPSDRDNTAAETKPFPIAPLATELLEDAVADFFPSDAVGGFAVGSETPLVVESRTTNVGGDLEFGQAFPAQGLAGGLTTGGTADLVFLRSSDRHRTNVGLVNLSPATAAAVVTLFAGGGRLGSYRRTLPPFGQHQDVDVFGTYGAFPKGGLRAEVVLEGNGPVFAYASVVDRTSGDASTVQAVVRH